MDNQSSARLNNIHALKQIAFQRNHLILCISGNQLIQLALNWRSKWRSTGAPNGAQLALQTLNYVPNCHSCISGNKLRGGNRQTVTQNNMQKTHGRRTPGQEPRKHLRLWCWLKCVSTMRATLRDPSKKHPTQKNKKLLKKERKHLRLLGKHSLFHLNLVYCYYFPHIFVTLYHQTKPNILENQYQ